MPLGSIIGGLIGQAGANQAAGKYGEAAGNADYIRHHNEALLSPWYNAGQDANGLMAGLVGLGHYTSDGAGYGGKMLDAGNWQADQKNAFARFQPSPDYQFRLSEGTKALDRSAASKGMLLSGGQTKGVQQFGGDLASGEYNNWFSKLAGMSGQGLNATGTAVNSNIAATGMQGQALAGQGSAYQSGANALANGIMNGTKNAMSIFGAAGGFGGMGGGGGVSFNPAAAPSGGYGGYAGYADRLPGFGGF